MATFGCDGSEHGRRGVSTEAKAERSPKCGVKRATPHLTGYRAAVGARYALLQAVANAASAIALGQDNSDADRELDGDRFELRIPLWLPGAPIVCSR